MKDKEDRVLVFWKKLKSHQKSLLFTLHTSSTFYTGGTTTVGLGLEIIKLLSQKISNQENLKKDDILYIDIEEILRRKEDMLFEEVCICIIGRKQFHPTSPTLGVQSQLPSWL